MRVHSAVCMSPEWRMWLFGSMQVPRSDQIRKWLKKRFISRNPQEKQRARRHPIVETQQTTPACKRKSRTNLQRNGKRQAYALRQSIKYQAMREMRKHQSPTKHKQSCPKHPGYVKKKAKQKRSARELKLGSKRSRPKKQRAAARVLSPQKREVVAIPHQSQQSTMCTL